MRKCLALGAALLCGLMCPAAERAEAWSSEWIEVTAENGVKDDSYPLQTDHTGNEKENRDCRASAFAQGVFWASHCGYDVGGGGLRPADSFGVYGQPLPPVAWSARGNRKQGE